MGRDNDPDDRQHREKHKKDKRHSKDREELAEVNGDKQRHQRKERDTGSKRGSERDEGHKDKARDKERSRDKGARDRGRSERDADGTKGRSASRDRKRPREEDSSHRDRRHRAEDSQQDREAAEERRKKREAADLEDEMEKRRQRIAVWQEQRRAAQAAEEAEAKRREEEAEKWTLDDDLEDELGQAADRAAAQDLAEGSGEVDPLDAFMAENDAAAAEAARVAEAASVAGEEVDPLDAFMAAEVLPAVQQEGVASIKMEAGISPEAGQGTLQARVAQPPIRSQKPVRRRPLYYSSESSSGSEDEADSDMDDEEWARNVTAGKLSKSDKLGYADHSTINYRPFRRNFYIEVPELARMTKAEVAEYRLQLDDVKVRGVDVPKPVKRWEQCGLSQRVLDVIRKSGYERPMPIQAQALPVIMSGRDCIGIAKTGSGKTVAFVLPMLRHVKDQPALESGDGPVALIMAPTRELVVQISKDVKRFAKVVNLTCVMVYGGSGVSSQITELKRGAEIVVCTPGRMIDILVTSGGKITNLRRVTYLVMDEADRMFDMGFEPQITRIVGNIRPDRQVVMFSATFPRSVELLAKQVLQAPVEIQVGGRSVVNKDITQWVEIRKEDERFLRLLEILGEWSDKGKVLVFVQSQDQCDNLFRDLLAVGYGCLSLHGGKDQVDRESTLHDFKTDVCNLMIATSVAARGLDVKDLVLVINYDVPNHHEDYVHRVGRTGRAGNKGTAITFISPEEEKYAPDLVKALKESSAPVPQDLLALAEAFNEKRKRGEVAGRGSGYGGSGFKFDTAEEELRNAYRKAAAKEARKGAGESDEDDDDGGDGDGFGAEGAVRPLQPNNTVSVPDVELPAEARDAMKQARETAERLAKMPANWQPQQAANNPFLPNGELNPLVKAAQEVAMKIAQQAGMPASVIASAASGAVRAAEMAQRWMPNGASSGMHFEAEIEINDFPQHARWKVTHRDTMADLNERTGAAVTTKGMYYGPGQQPPEGERRLYLHIEGPTEQSVKECKREIKKILEETTERAMRRDGAQAMGGGRYNV